MKMIILVLTALLSQGGIHTLIPAIEAEETTSIVQESEENSILKQEQDCYRTDCPCDKNHPQQQDCEQVQNRNNGIHQGHGNQYRHHN